MTTIGDLMDDFQERQDAAKRIPPEPPVGTWVMDRYGATHYRRHDGWSAAPSGFYAFGIWSAMWEGRGPLVECSPWGTVERKARQREDLKQAVFEAETAVEKAREALRTAEDRLREAMQRAEDA
jgi:hypothetical protein